MARRPVKESPVNRDIALIGFATLVVVTCPTAGPA